MDNFTNTVRLGTGIHQVVIFAVAATVAEESIICIEEPEVNLHPRLQRKLLEYLQQQTNNQYFISTHSASLLDAQGVSIFHVSMGEDGASAVDTLAEVGTRAKVCFDLGYKASDLVQANSIVWVEGPSDRIYVNAWLHEIDPELVEGLHYSIMFYGGRLLSHLSADDSTVSDFIALQRLNRHVAILFDSDKDKAASHISATKRRVRQEVERAGGFAWVTRGREIENYLQPATLSGALTDVHPRKTFLAAADEFAYCYAPADGDRKSIDKIALATHAVQVVDLDRLDLRSKVSGLAKFIRDANA